MVKITWTIEGSGVGSATVADTEAAAKALSGAVRDAMKPHGPDVQARALIDVVGPLRAAMVTDGRTAVERGQPWSAHLGGIAVSLSRE